MTIKELFKEWKKQAKELGVWDVPVETACGYESLLLFPTEGKYKDSSVTFVFDEHERLTNNDLKITVDSLPNK